MKSVSECKFLGCDMNSGKDDRIYYNVTLFDSEPIRFSASKDVFDYVKKLDFGCIVLVEFIIGTFNNRPNLRISRIQVK